MPLYAAFLQHYMHMPRRDAIWRIPFIAGIRLRLAYMELQGESQDWGASELDAIVARAKEIMAT